MENRVVGNRVRPEQQSEGPSVEEKLQHILHLYRHEQSLVSNLNQEVDSKRKRLIMLQDSVAKIERDVSQQEEVLYHARLKLTRLNEQAHGYTEFEHAEKRRQLETYSAIKLKEESIDTIEATLKQENLNYIQTLHNLNKQVFSAYQQHLAHKSHQLHEK